MTVGETSACGRLKAGNMASSQSFTAISTIAIQAGQSQLVVSILKSGSVVHLQLVQVQPGLCETGSDQEENQILIQEQQLLLDKLKNHEGEVLSAVENKRQAEQKKNRNQEVEEEGVYEAMAASLSEGWLLLLRLLQRRRDVLTLAAEFYQRTLEFSLGIDQLEDLQTRTDEQRLTEVQLRYSSLRRDLLRKSLQVLTCSNILLQKLRQLQRTEDLQRTGGVLQEEEEEEQEEESSRRCGKGVGLWVEQQVEELQDRRRRADQAVRLQLQCIEQSIMVRQEEEEGSGRHGSDDWSLKIVEILDQNLRPRSGPEETTEMLSGSGSDLKSGSRSALKSQIRVEESRNFQSGSTSGLKSRSTSDPGPGPDETINLQSRFRLNLKTESRPVLQLDSQLHMKPGSGSEETKELQNEPRLAKPGSGSNETRNLWSRFRLNPKTESRSEETVELRLGSEVKPCSGLDLKSGSRPWQTRDLPPESSSELPSGSRPEETRDLQPGSVSDETRVMGSELRSETKDFHGQSRSTSDVEPEAGSDLRAESRSEESRDFQVLSVPVVKLGSRLSVEPLYGFDVKSGSVSGETGHLQLGSGSGSEETRDLQSGSGSASEETRDLQSGSGSESGSEETRDLQSGSGSASEDEELPAAHSLSRGRAAALQSMLGKDSPRTEDPTHSPSLLTNQRQQQLLSSFEGLMEKVCMWMQQSSSLLLNSCEAGGRLIEAEHTLNTHLQLHTQAQFAGLDLQNLNQILDQLRDPGCRLSPLKALTEQLKRGRASRPGPTASLNSELTARPGPVGSELAAQVDLVQKDLQNLNKKINVNLQLLEPFVSFLRTTQQVEEELAEVHRRRPEEEQEEEAGGTDVRPPQKKKLEVLQRLVTAEELGKSCIQAVTTASGAGLNLQSVMSSVRRTLQRLEDTKQEAMSYWKQQEIASKTLQDLQCVSALLDSISKVDLGSESQTLRLLQSFHQAGHHFSQLNAEVEYVVRSWQTLRGVQEVKEVRMEEEELSELLRLHQRVKEKIHQSESILELSSSFHLTANQLEALLQSEPGTGSTGSCETDLGRLRENQQQIQSLLQTASALKMRICEAVSDSDWTGFRSDQLDGHLRALDSACRSWLKEAAHREEKLHREQLTRLLLNDITQIRDSFKDLKKRFSNMKFNFLKRNDRTRNLKALSNQLQQVDVVQDRLQVLRKRVQDVAARLGSEVKDGGVAREVEDAANELQRQMGEFERSVREHRQTVDMTSRLQQAVEEYQFWCEEASATIARVGKFSSECRSTEAVSVLYRQFEKFVWPTVPQQEERIGQISELAVRLHGVEEGRRYIEKTVSKHSEMVESIKELSDGLMELEAKLRLENLKQQQSNNQKETKEEEEIERRMATEMDEKEKKKMKETRKLKRKEQRDNRSSLEATDLYELKETGHTPELTADYDGKEVPVKRQAVTNRKPPLQKVHGQEADRRTVASESRHQSHSERFTSSYSSSHTVTISCSPAEAFRRVHAIHSQSQAVVTTEPQVTPPQSVIGPLFLDIQREFQGNSNPCESNPLQDASAGGLSEAELHQQEVMTEDSLSNDEYECPSPDDISLPPLAETPESIMVQSDVEEGFCFSSHSVHINQYSHQYQQQTGTGTATGAVRESRQTDSCPTPPTSLHSNTRFRPESTSFVQSPLTVSGPGIVTSSLCTILRTEEISTANLPQSADDHFQLGPEPSLSSEPNPVHNSSTPDNCPQKVVPDGRIAQNVESKCDLSPQAAVLNQSCSPQPFKGPDPDLNTLNTPPQDTGIHKSGPAFPQTRTGISEYTNLPQEKSFPQEMNSVKTMKDTTPQRDNLTSTRTSTMTQQTIYFQSLPNVNSSLLHVNPSSQIETCPKIDPLPEIKGFAQSPAERRGRDQDAPSSQTSSLTTTTTVIQQTASCQSFPSDSHCSAPQASSSLPQGSPLSKGRNFLLIHPVPKARGVPQSPSPTDTVLHKNRTLSHDTGPLKSCTSECSLPQPYPKSKTGLDQDVSSPKTSSLTTTMTVAQQTASCQSDSHYSAPQAHNPLRSQQKKPSVKESQGLTEVDQVPIPPEPNSVRESSNNGFSNQQSHHAVHSLHESLTSTCTQQCVHDPGMTHGNPARSAAAPPHEVQALAQLANSHVTPLSSPPHLLTPDQDPDICLPVAIREEIRLTPQIQGPPLPAPPPLPAQAQAESLPQVKASRPVPPCFTRPLSRATIMEGSPVTLEVEVTGHPEPMLTWFKDGGVSSSGPGQAPLREDRKDFLFVPEASDSDGGLYKTRAAHHHDSADASDRWLVAEVFDIISVDWHTWFGTLCVLLWLLFLTLL